MAKEKITYVIIVDKKDKETGKEEKIKAHQEGKLHRAFSIFIFNKKGELLLQKRAASKYHSPCLWSNTCCSHPRPGFDLKGEAKKRLKEEMGLEVDLKEIFTFVYRVKIGKLIEHEFDHIFIGKFNEDPKPNGKEVKEWRWISKKDLKKALKENPEKYTSWFKIILNKAPSYRFLWKNLK